MVSFLQAQWGDFKYDDQDFHSIGLNDKGVNIDVLVGKSHMEKQFKAFIEPWEETVLRKKGVKSEILLLRKYGNIRLYDTDKGLEPRRICNLRVKFIGRADYNCYCVLVREEGELTDDNESEWEPFPINSDLHFMIRSFYKKNPGENVVLMLLLLDGMLVPLD